MASYPPALAACCNCASTCFQLMIAKMRLPERDHVMSSVFASSVRSIFLAAHLSFNSAQTLCSRVCGTTNRSAAGTSDGSWSR